jgi:hypothetical protein
MSGGLGGHADGSQLAKFVVDERQQLSSGMAIAARGCSRSCVTSDLATDPINYSRWGIIPRIDKAGLRLEADEVTESSSFAAQGWHHFFWLLRRGCIVSRLHHRSRFDQAAGKSRHTGNPNGFGNVGTIDISNLNNIQTTRLYTSLQPAHGIVYDSFSGRITLFGAGQVATIDPNNPSTSLLVSGQINGDFDQGAVDGHGHAFIAGNNDLTFIDYSQTHDITNPNDAIRIVGGFGGIDDLAPLSGAGSAQTPAPSSLVMISGFLAVCGLMCWSRRRQSIMAAAKV